MVNVWKVHAHLITIGLYFSVLVKSAHKHFQVLPELSIVCITKDYNMEYSNHWVWYLVLKSSTGRSMGCRAAAALARQLSDESQDAVQGVICLSFPLHPPGQTHVHRQRSEDLRGLPEHMPVLCVSGTEDNMCDKVRTDGRLFILSWRAFHTVLGFSFCIYMCMCVELLIFFSTLSQ